MKRFLDKLERWGEIGLFTAGALAFAASVFITIFIVVRAIQLLA